MRQINILAISGSLRGVSINSMFLRACNSLIPDHIDYRIYQGLATLPLFNPDIEGEDYSNPAPEEVRDFRNQLDWADGVLISSPEYAHGVTGALKNALDWIVGSGGILNKPLALYNLSPRATYAIESLREIVTVMEGKIHNEASLTLDILEKYKSVKELLASENVTQKIQASLKDFADAIATQG